jgi:tetratricopeptide (TPR) repeat protein
MNRLRSAAGAHTRRLSWRAALLHPAFLPALIAFTVHLPSVRFGFVRDDTPLIVENAFMRGPGMLGQLLAGDFLASLGYTSGLWRPLVLLSLWVEGRLGGWTPTLFHATNILMHTGVTLLLGLLLLQAGVSRWAALTGALWFAVMPAHLESIAWILGRTDLMCGGFALLSLWLDRRARARGRALPSGWALAAFAAALLSKEAAAGWVAVIAAAELARSRWSAAGRREIARWLAPYLALTALWLVVHALAAGRSELPPYLDAALRARRHAAALVMLPQYLAFLWPWYPHSSDVALWLPPPGLGWSVAAGAAFTLFCLAVVGVLGMRRSPAAVPGAIVVVALVPSVALALAKAFLTSGERMVYLPSAGVAWLAVMALGWAVRQGGASRWAAITASAVLIIGSGAETLRVQPSWADDARVFQTMTARQPGNPVGWVGLAAVFAQSGRKEDAESALARAAAIAPHLPAVDIGRAELHYQYGEWEAVVANVDRALDLDDTSFQARLLRASTLVRLRRTEEAGRDLERLMRDRPGHPSVLMVEGQRLLMEGRPAEAVAPLEDAARRQPDEPGAWFALASARAAVDDPGAARLAIERGLDLEPGYVAGWRMLARLCAALGDSAASKAAWARARALIGAHASGEDTTMHGPEPPDGGPR